MYKIVGLDSKNFKKSIKRGIRPLFFVLSFKKWSIMHKMASWKRLFALNVLNYQGK
jgi:hypothetical protein